MGTYYDSVSRYIESVKPVLDNIASMVSRRATAGGKPVEISVSYKDDMHFNAYASKGPGLCSIASQIEGGRYTVTINRGVGIRLAYIFEAYTSCWQELLAHPGKYNIPVQVFEHIDRDDVISRKLDFTTNYEFGVVRCLFVEDYEDQARIDSIKAIAGAHSPFNFRGVISEPAKNAVGTALQFIALHECAHIGRGHLEYLSRFHSTNLISELNIQHLSRNSKMYRVMEYDADTNALVNILINHIRAMSDNVISASKKTDVPILTLMHPPILLGT